VRIGVNTSIGFRLEYWKRSLAFIAEAPVIGHGTGTIPMLFRRGSISDIERNANTLAHAL
jgi:O-antigen ligase